MRSASSTCVSLRWRRSCRIFLPTSSSCAGLFICVSLTFYAIGQYYPAAINLRAILTRVKPSWSSDHLPRSSSSPRIDTERLQRPFHRVGPRLHLHDSETGRGGEGLHLLSHLATDPLAGDQRGDHPLDDIHRRECDDGPEARVQE